MTFKKLALAAAVAMVPVTGFSVETLDDENLSGVTGQDGIRMTWTGTSIGMDIGVHDKDGITGVTAAVSYTFDGGIFIDNMSMGFSGGIGIDIDAGANALTAGSPTLNIRVTLPNPTTIVTGSIQVGNSARDEGSWAINATTATIIESTTIELGTTTMNIELGNEPQGNMIALNTTINNGVVLNGFTLNDANSGGGISASSISITDDSGSNLSLNVGINVVGTGLEIGLGTVGAATGMDVRIADLRLGSAGAAILGDISIDGLNINGTTLTISGK